MVRRTPMERLYQNLIRRHHYPGHVRPGGKHLEYFFSQDRPIRGCEMLIVEAVK
jgi:hypothetical protein